MKTLLNLLILAVILFITISLIAINQTYGQSGQAALLQINQYRFLNDLSSIKYDYTKEKQADKLLNRYIRKGYFPVDKIDYSEYYVFEGDKPNVKAIVDVACIGNYAWFHEDIKCAVLRFRYDLKTDTVHGIGLYFR